MIIYTATHSSGAVKVRKCKTHTEPRYTHAMWLRNLDYPAAFAHKWECRGIAQLSSLDPDDWRRNGWEVEITPVSAREA